MSNWPSKLICLVLFLGVSIVHHETLGDSDGFLYYGSAAFFDLFVIYLLSRINHAHINVLFMQVICLLFIMLNCIGWVMWYLYLPPDYYNLSCYALYIAAVISIFKRGGDERITAINRMCNCVNFNNMQSNFTDIRNKGQA